MAVVRQVPKRSMAAREEQAVIGCLVNFRQLDAVGERMCCPRVFFKTPRIVGLERRLVALRIKWRLAALGRGERDIDPGITENEIGSSELLEPNPVFLPVFPSWSCDVSTMRIFILLTPPCDEHYKAERRARHPRRATSATCEIGAAATATRNVRRMIEVMGVSLLPKWKSSRTRTVAHTVKMRASV